MPRRRLRLKHLESQSRIWSQLDPVKAPFTVDLAASAM